MVLYLLQAVSFPGSLSLDQYNLSKSWSKISLNRVQNFSNATRRCISRAFRTCHCHWRRESSRLLSRPPAPAVPLRRGHQAADPLNPSHAGLRGSEFLSLSRDREGAAAAARSAAWPVRAVHCEPARSERSPKGEGRDGGRDSQTPLANQFSTNPTSSGIKSEIDRGMTAETAPKFAEGEG